jgi:hypothetical protein
VGSLRSCSDGSPKLLKCEARRFANSWFECRCFFFRHFSVYRPSLLATLRQGAAAPNSFLLALARFFSSFTWMPGMGRMKSLTRNRAKSDTHVSMLTSFRLCAAAEKPSHLIGELQSPFPPYRYARSSRWISTQQFWNHSCDRDDCIPVISHDFRHG